VFQITRSVSNISAMNISTTRTRAGGANGTSEVANDGLSCYGVFRKLELEDDDDLVDRGGDSVCGVGRAERVTGRRRRRPTPPPPLSTSSSSTVELSPQEFAFAYVTAAAAVGAGAADDDDDDDDDFDRRTYLVYDDVDRGCCDTTTTTTTTTITAADHSRCYRIGDLIWDEYGCGAATVDATGGDLRAVGGAAAPFSHTPMGSTTKLVGLDTSSDDTPKVLTQQTYNNIFMFSRQFFLFVSHPPSFPREPPQLDENKGCDGLL